ncbi:acyltransferase family protein [Escherichia coli]
MKHRLAYLDLLRIVSVVLVMWGHFVMVAGGAQAIPGIINPDFTPLPLIDQTQWRAYLLEVFLVETFSTQSAILGVSLFFLITGYLMPMMCDRYSRTEFLLNRFFRIFPTLIAAAAILGIFLYLTQGITFSAATYIASITLTYPWLGIVPLAGVLWTLVIEVLFYFIAFSVGTFTLRRLIFTQAILLLTIFLGVVYRDHYYLWLAGYQARFLLFITIGSAIYLAEKEEAVLTKIATLLPSIILSYVGFQLFKLGKVDASTYENLGTHLLSAVIFLGFYHLGPVLLTRLPRMVDTLADLVYPFYLIHTAIGLVAMALVREHIHQPYLILLSAVLASLLASWVLHQCVEKPAINFGRRFTRSKSTA